MGDICEYLQILGWRGHNPALSGMWDKLVKDLKDITNHDVIDKENVVKPSGLPDVVGFNAKCLWLYRSKSFVYSKFIRFLFLSRTFG